MSVRAAPLGCTGCWIALKKRTSGRDGCDRSCDSGYKLGAPVYLAIVLDVFSRRVVGWGRWRHTYAQSW